jgi:hypothetical protein
MIALIAKNVFCGTNTFVFSLQKSKKLQIATRRPTKRERKSKKEREKAKKREE